jgi:hypothetical protein
MGVDLQYYVIHTTNGSGPTMRYTQPMGVNLMCDTHSQWEWLPLFGTDPDRNRLTCETPNSEAIPCRRKPLRRTLLLRDPAQMQVWREQVWLNSTFISQGSRSWDKLAVETWRVKTKLIIITTLHIIITRMSILNLRLKQLRQKYWLILKCIKNTENIHKYLQQQKKSSKIIKYWRLPKILANA